MKNPEIKTAVISDCERISQVSFQTYIETYSEFFNQEVLNNFMEEKFNSNNIKQELENKLFTYLIALYDNKIIGYAKLKHQSSPTEIKLNNTMEIERIYILKKFQSLKIGSKLLQKCIEKALHLNCNSVWLAVWEHNHKAISFYKNLGFELKGSINFFLGKQKLNDFLMLMDLTPLDKKI